MDQNEEEMKRPPQPPGDRPGVCTAAVRMAAHKAGEPQPPQWYCMDCNKPYPGWFEVTDELWNKMGFEHYWTGIICISCFEKRMIVRLKRVYALTDFTDSPLNDGVRMGYVIGKTNG